jgi:hypothetical protein
VPGLDGDCVGTADVASEQCGRTLYFKKMAALQIRRVRKERTVLTRLWNERGREFT